MKYILMACLWIGASLAFAQESSDLLAQYAQKINEVKTLQSDFTEEKHLSLLSQPIESTGRLTFDKNAQQLYWQYQTPFINGFLIEGKRVYRLQGESKNLVQNAMGRMMAAQMVTWLTLDFETLKRDYEITLHNPKIVFVPRNKTHKLVKQITIWLDEKNPQLVKQVQMEEPSGDSVVWKFNNIRINPLIDGSVL